MMDEAGAWVNLGQASLNGYERNQLYHNRGPDGHGRPRLLEVGHQSHTDLEDDGRSAVAFDADGDGDLDLAVQSYGRPARLLLNETPSDGHWLQIRLRGTVSNRDAIGARVTIEAGGVRQQRDLTSTAGYLAGASRMLHFGLGAADRVDRITVRWPSGEVTQLNGVASDQQLIVTEPNAASGPAR